MASKNPRARLLHIRDEIEGVGRTVSGLSFAQYQDSYMHRRAVERAAMIVSEAASALPPDILARYADAPGVPSSASAISCDTNTSGSMTSNSGKLQRFICQNWHLLWRECSPNSTTDMRS